MEQKRPADIIQELLDYLWNGLGLEEKGWRRLKKGDFKKKMKNGLTYQIWFDRSRYNYIDYEIGHGNVEVGFSCIIKQGDDYLYSFRIEPTTGGSFFRMLTEDLRLNTGLLDTFLPLVKANYLDFIDRFEADPVEALQPVCAPFTEAEDYSWFIYVREQMVERYGTAEQMEEYRRQAELRGTPGHKAKNWMGSMLFHLSHANDVDQAWASSRTREELDQVVEPFVQAKRQTGQWTQEDEAGYQLYRQETDPKKRTFRVWYLIANPRGLPKEFVQKELDDKKGPQPGGPYLIQMLFKEPVEMPDKEKMTAIMEKHIGSTECFCYDKKMAGFAALDHVAEFQDGKCPVQLMVMKCDKFKGKGFDAFLMSQMWDCQEDRDRIFRECKYQVVATDMLTAALPALERANLDADFLEALAELYPTCEAFYFQNCGKLFLAEDVRSHQIEGPDRFIRFGVNVRFFNIEGTEDMLIDTVGMSTLFLPDLQYHFHGMDPNWVVNHAYNAASYILEHDNPIEDGETIDGVADGQMCREIQWKCQYEDALIQPPRGVLDINMGNYASGGR